MTLTQLINQYNGKPDDFDGNKDPECVDTAKRWASLIGQAIVIGNGKDWAKRFNWVDYQLGRYPHEGDIIVWGTGVGKYGHVAIAISGNINGFSSFDQNWRLDHRCHIESHSYHGVLGWNQKEQPMDEQRVKFDGTVETHMNRYPTEQEIQEMLADFRNLTNQGLEKVAAERETFNRWVDRHRTEFNQKNGGILG